MLKEQTSATPIKLQWKNMNSFLSKLLKITGLIMKKIIKEEKLFDQKVNRNHTFFLRDNCFEKFWLMKWSLGGQYKQFCWSYIFVIFLPLVISFDPQAGSSSELLWKENSLKEIGIKKMKHKSYTKKGKHIHCD